MRAVPKGEPLPKPGAERRDGYPALDAEDSAGPSRAPGDGSRDGGATARAPVNRARRTASRLDWQLAWPMLRPLALPLSVAALALCLFGVGFWLIEPTTPRLLDGLWLAYATASTIGYGDLVPTTTASRLLAVPVLLLGFAVLSMVTAAIAAMWVESHERRIEREILRDMHSQMRLLHQEIAALRPERGPARDDSAAASTAVSRGASEGAVPRQTQ